MCACGDERQEHDRKRAHADAASSTDQYEWHKTLRPILWRIEMGAERRCCPRSDVIVTRCWEPEGGSRQRARRIPSNNLIRVNNIAAGRAWAVRRHLACSQPPRLVPARRAV